MNFNSLDRKTNPTEKDLPGFITKVKEFLGSIVEDEEHFGYIWRGDDSLREAALDTLESDINSGAGDELDNSILELTPENIFSHGLSGTALFFKFKVIATLSREWRHVKNLGMKAVSGWLQNILDAIDALLDSIIDAAGVGSVIKEFKDALGALA